MARTVNRRSKGFTLIEFMIVIAIIGILAAVIGGGTLNREGVPTDGTVCVGGFKFVDSYDGSAPRQVLSETGGGIACN